MSYQANTEQDNPELATLIRSYIDERHALGELNSKSARCVRARLCEFAVTWYRES